MQISLFSKRKLSFIVKGDTDIYTVRYNRYQKRWVCSCKSFKYNKMRETEYCKHVKEVMKYVQFNKINLE